AEVCAELAAGRKESHWMWFVFPQLAGLGSSATARHYAIGSLEEARAYLAHPVLGPRLRECTGLVNRIEGRSVEAIFGYPDYLKFRWCMTLFARAAETVTGAVDAHAPAHAPTKLSPADVTSFFTASVSMGWSGAGAPKPEPFSAA